jgi:hypothetical protein
VKNSLHASYKPAGEAMTTNRLSIDTGRGVHVDSESRMLPYGNENVYYWDAPDDVTEVEARGMVQNISRYSGYSFIRLEGKRRIYYSNYISIGD